MVRTTDGLIDAFVTKTGITPVFVTNASVKPSGMCAHKSTFQRSHRIKKKKKRSNWKIF